MQRLKQQLYADLDCQCQEIYYERKFWRASASKALTHCIEKISPSQQQHFRDAVHMQNAADIQEMWPFFKAKVILVSACSQYVSRELKLAVVFFL